MEVASAMKERKSGNSMLICVFVLLTMSVAILQIQKKPKEPAKHFYAHQDTKKDHESFGLI
jgi:hypothetical protein